MPKEQEKMQSWQVFHFARKRLGASALCVIFGKKNARAVDYWCQDPMYTDKSEQAYDPIQGVKNLLSMLDDRGHVGAVRNCIAFLCSGTSLDCGCEPEIVAPLPTLTEEILADYKAVACLQAAIEDKIEPAVIKALAAEAIAEIERTCAKYIEGC
ncbi:MAG: hypothetical protein PHZ02_07120 [Desulfocapsaceae bacterium]|nr:hypothetical protein [Desulfocapsaceae bacterium]